MLAPPERKAQTRARKARHRQRVRNGSAVFQLEANRDAVLLALIESGKLSDQDALDRRRVNAVLSKMLQAWADHWRDGLR